MSWEVSQGWPLFFGAPCPDFYDLLPACIGEQGRHDTLDGGSSVSVMILPPRTAGHQEGLAAVSIKEPSHEICLRKEDLRYVRSEPKAAPGVLVHMNADHARLDQSEPYCR
jgi:hypothetical protein